MVLVCLWSDQGFAFWRYTVEILLGWSVHPSVWRCTVFDFDFCWQWQDLLLRPSASLTGGLLGRGACAGCGSCTWLSRASWRTLRGLGNILVLAMETDWQGGYFDWCQALSWLLVEQGGWTSPVGPAVWLQRDSGGDRGIDTTTAAWMGRGGDSSELWMDGWWIGARVGIGWMSWMLT